MTVSISSIKNYMSANMNLLLSGPAGVGKTAMLRQAADELGWKMKYYSASTLDPYTDLVGIPVPQNDTKTVEFYRPKQIDELFMIAVDEGIPVLAYGIRTDFRTAAFPGSARLLEIAHSLEELKTICRCGRKAIFNGRMVNGRFIRSGEQVALDGAEVQYESLCGSCYVEKVQPLTDIEEP